MTPISKHRTYLFVPFPSTNNLLAGLLPTPRSSCSNTALAFGVTSLILVFRLIVSSASRSAYVIFLILVRSGEVMNFDVDASELEEMADVAFRFRGSDTGDGKVLAGDTNRDRGREARGIRIRRVGADDDECGMVGFVTVKSSTSY